jgi:hypothetical protein
MSRRFTFTTFIERGDEEREIHVTYTCTPFIAQTYWQPAESGEVEVEEAVFVSNAHFMPSPLTDAEWDKLVEEARGRAYEDMAADAADRAAYLYEQRRDRLLDEQIDREFGK